MSKLKISDDEAVKGGAGKGDADKGDTGDNLGDNLGVELMETETDDLSLVLEETQPEAPPTKAAATTAPSDVATKPVKKRVPLTTIATTTTNQPAAASTATPEKAKGRRVNLITLSSPKPKS